jgi:hypothetical protein
VRRDRNHRWSRSRRRVRVLGPAAGGVPRYPRTAGSGAQDRQCAPEQLSISGQPTTRSSSSHRGVKATRPQVLTIPPAGTRPGVAQQRLCLSSLKERGRSIPRTKIVSMLCVVPSVEAGTRQPADGFNGEAPAAQRGRAALGRQGLMQNGSGAGTGCLIDGLLQAGVEVGGSSIASNRSLSASSAISLDSSSVVRLVALGAHR